MDFGLAPPEGYSVLVVAIDEGVDRRAQLGDRGEAGALKRAAGEDREPDLDLVEPRRMGRRKVEVDVLVPGEPGVALGLVGREVVEDDVNLAVPVSSHHLIHEVEELGAPAA